MLGKLLIVEDEPIIALDLQQEFEELGCEVTGLAESADSALMSVEENAPDLVVMDIRIDGSMDGIQAARLLRHAYHIPVLFLTSYSDSETLRRAACEMPYGYLTKPFKSCDLRASLEMALHKAAVDAELRKSSRMMSTSLHGMHEAIVLVAADGMVQYMNQAAIDISGLGNIRARSMLLKEVFDLTDIYRNSVPMPVRRGEAMTIEEFGWFLRVPGRDRMIVDFSIRSLVGEDGAQAGHVLTLRNAAERMRQRLLEASTAEAETFDNAPMAMVQLDGEGHIMRINQKLLLESGLPMEQLIGRSLTALLADPDPLITKHFVYRLLRPFRSMPHALA